MGHALPNALEPISALDVNIQAQIINLLIDLQQRFAPTYLFIAHDLGGAPCVGQDRCALSGQGVMEVAPASALFPMRLCIRTRWLLIAAAPIPDAIVERRRERVRVTGEPPSAIDLPSGCLPHALPGCDRALRERDPTD